MFRGCQNQKIFTVILTLSSHDGAFFFFFFYGQGEGGGGSEAGLLVAFPLRSATGDVTSHGNYDAGAPFHFGLLYFPKTSENRLKLTGKYSDGPLMHLSMLSPRGAFDFSEEFLVKIPTVGPQNWVKSDQMSPPFPSIYIENE